MEPEQTIRATEADYQNLMHMIADLNRWLQGSYTQVLKSFGLSFQQYNVLQILSAQHPLPATVTLLIERMHDKSSNVSRLVEKLRKKELVRRIQRPTDGR